MTQARVHISQAISCDALTVAVFAGAPENLPRWAAGLSTGIRNVDGRWITDSPMGEAEVRFTGDVAQGILDHDVTFPGGEIVRNPLRVVRNGEGSEVVFTLFKSPTVSDVEFERDAALVREDLHRLRDLLESTPS